MTWKTLIGRLAVSTGLVAALALAAGADSWDTASNWVSLLVAWLASLS
jgi:hypothetical protein